MTTLLTEIPWWVSVGLVFAGFVILTHGNRRSNEKVRAAGLLVVSLAFLLGAARFLIDTDAERCERRTRHIVDAANNHDWAAFQNLLDADTAIDLGNKGARAKGPAEIRKVSEAVAKQVGLEHVVVVSSHTEQSPGLIAMTISAASLQDDTQDRAFSTGWEFDYGPVNGQWHLKLIKLLSMGTETVQ
jgi:hypothetical protein